MRLSVIEPMALLDSAGNRTHLSQKEKEVVAMLLANPNGIPRQVLHNRLWPTSTVESRQVRLSQTLSKLRRGLTGEVVYASDGNLRLRINLDQSELGDIIALRNAIVDSPSDEALRHRGQQLYSDLSAAKLCPTACELIPDLRRRWMMALDELQEVLNKPVTLADDNEPKSTTVPGLPVEQHTAGKHVGPFQWHYLGLIFFPIAILSFVIYRQCNATLANTPIVPIVRQVDFEQTILAEDKEVIGLPTNSESTALAESPSGVIYACGYMRTKDSDVDGFLMRVNPSGGIAWKTRLGGVTRDCDRAFSVVTQPDGNTWVAGDTYIDKPLRNHNRLIEPGWHLIVWKVSPTGKLLDTYIGGFIAGESPRAAWLVTDNVGGVWAAIQSRKPLGTVPELLHVRSSGVIETNIQVGNRMFQITSVASDRFGQVFIGGVEDETAAGTHKLENYVICIDARGREVLRKPIGRIESRNTSNLTVMPGPNDQMWLARTAQVANGYKYIVSLMSSTTFALTDVTSYPLSNSGQQVVASLSKSNNAADLAIVETESNNSGKSVVFAPMSAETKTAVMMPSVLMNQTIVPIRLGPVQTRPYSIICRVNPLDENKQNLLRFVLSDSSATVTSFAKPPAFIVTSCTDNVCIGRVHRGDETHAIVLRMK